MEKRKQILKRNKIFVFSIILFCLEMSFTSIKQDNIYKEKEIIVWNENNKLKWDYFKGKVPESKYGAITCSTIYSKFESGNFLILNTRACFVKKESWHKDGYSIAYYLNHEQKHFDITEIYARKLRKTLTDTVFKTETIAKKEINRIIRSNNKALNDYQDLYDKETNHSINKENQSLWDKKIDEELKSLSNYTKNIVEIKIN